MQSLETFSESGKRQSSINEDDESPKARRPRGNGSEAVAFLKIKAERDAELRQEQIKLKGEEIKLKMENGRGQRDFMTQQQKVLCEFIYLYHKAMRKYHSL